MNIKSDKLEDNVTLEQAQKEYKEAIDIFPALHRYQAEHSMGNLRKLCVEIAEFCRAVYSSTRSAEERNVYYEMLGKIAKGQFY